MSHLRRRSVLLALVLAAVIATVALLETGLRRDPDLTASPLVGRSAPDFRLAGLQGPAVRLSALRGQVVVVNFWASWCLECRTEQEALDQTWDRFRDSGVVVLGVNFQDNATDAGNYIAAAGLTYPNVEDADSRTALAYGVRGVPETFVVGRSGRIVDRFIGPVDADRLARTVNTLSAGDAP